MSLVKVMMNVVTRDRTRTVLKTRITKTLVRTTKMKTMVKAITTLTHIEYNAISGEYHAEMKKARAGDESN